MSAYPTRHVASRALLAAIAGRLWFHRLSTPVLEQLRGVALVACHGRKDSDPVLLAALHCLREVDSTLTRRARLDAAERAALAEVPERTVARPVTEGGTKVLVGPSKPGPLPPAYVLEPEGAL